MASVSSVAPLPAAPSVRTLTTNPLITGNVVGGRVVVTGTVVTGIVVAGATVVTGTVVVDFTVVAGTVVAGATVVARNVATDFTAVGESAVVVGNVFAVVVVVATAIDVVAVGGFVFNAATLIVGVTVVVGSTVVVTARVLKGAKVGAFDVVGSRVVEGTLAVPLVVGAMGRGADSAAIGLGSVETEDSGGSGGLGIVVEVSPPKTLVVGSAGAGIVTSGVWATGTGPGMITKDVGGLSTVVGTGGAGT